MRKCDASEKIDPGSRIRVEGRLGTFHHVGGSENNPSPFGESWVIYMDVEKVTIIHPAETNSPEADTPRTEADTSLGRLPVLHLNRYGDLAGQRIDDIVVQQDVSSVIVLNNATSAPEEMHIRQIDRILETNPKIQSFYFTDPNTGHRTRSHKSEVNGFFRALLLTKNADCIGFELSRDRARIYNKEGDGLVILNKDYKRPQDPKD